MKSPFVLTLLFLFLLTPKVDAQIKKGMSLFSFSGSYDIPNYVPSQILDELRNTNMRTLTTTSPLNSTLAFDSHYYRMISNRIMIGAAFNYFHTKEDLFVRNFITTSGFIDRSLSSRYFISTKLSTTFRYYITTKKAAAFFSIEPQFNQYRATARANYEREAYLSVLIGLGANFFITPNIALDLHFKTAAIQTPFNSWPHNATETPRKQFIAHLGLQFFIHDFNYSKDHFEAESILKKGNVTLEGDFNFITRYQNKDEPLYLFAPKIKYFISNTITVESGFKYSKFERSDTMDIHLGFSFHLKVADHFYMVPTLAANVYKYNILLDVKGEWYFPFTLAFHSFRANKKYFLGATFTHHLNENVVSPIKIFTGLEYYVAQNLSITGTLNLFVGNIYQERYYDPDNNDSDKELPKVRPNLSFGFNFWL